MDCRQWDSSQSSGAVSNQCQIIKESAPIVLISALGCSHVGLTVDMHWLSGRKSAWARQAFLPSPLRDQLSSNLSQTACGSGMLHISLMVPTIQTWDPLCQGLLSTQPIKRSSSPLSSCPSVWVLQPHVVWLACWFLCCRNLFDFCCDEFVEHTLTDQVPKWSGLLSPWNCLFCHHDYITLLKVFTAMPKKKLFFGSA